MLERINEWGFALSQTLQGQLEAGSLDFYSALRSAYLQSRDAMVREARGQAAEAGIVTVDAN